MHRIQMEKEKAFDDATHLIEQEKEKLQQQLLIRREADVKKIFERYYCHANPQITRRDVRDASVTHCQLQTDIKVRVNKQQPPCQAGCPPQCSRCQQP